MARGSSARIYTREAAGGGGREGEAASSTSWEPRRRDRWRGLPFLSFVRLLIPPGIFKMIAGFLFSFPLLVSSPRAPLAAGTGRRRKGGKRAGAVAPWRWSCHVFDYRTGGGTWLVVAAPSVWGDATVRDGSTTPYRDGVRDELICWN